MPGGQFGGVAIWNVAVEDEPRIGETRLVNEVVGKKRNPRKAAYHGEDILLLRVHSLAIQIRIGRRRLGAARVRAARAFA